MNRRHQLTLVGAALVIVAVAVVVSVALTATSTDTGSSLPGGSDSTPVGSTPVGSGRDVDEPDAGGRTPLAVAVARGDLDEIDRLLAAGADPDAAGLGGLTPLHIAAQLDAADAVDALIAGGADLDVRSANGMNALQHAADTGGASSVRALVAAGAPIDARSGVITQGHGHPRDRGPVALAIAARAGNEDTTAELLELGAEVDATSDVGITPLLAAVFADAPPGLVASLLDAGADPGVAVGCDQGCSIGPRPLDAVEWAAELERDELRPLLTAAG